MIEDLTANDFSILSVIARQNSYTQHPEKYPRYFRNLTNFGEQVARNILGDNPPNNTSTADAAQAARLIERYVAS